MNDTRKGKSRVQLATASLTLHPKSAEKVVAVAWLKPVGRHEFKALRKLLRDSASDFGKRLAGVIRRNRAFSRSYIKHVEGGSMKAAPPLAEAFRKLQAQVRGLPNAKPVQLPRTLISRFNVPEEVRALIRARRCRGHRRWNYFKTTTQVWCDPKDECKRVWRRRNRKARPKAARQRCAGVRRRKAKEAQHRKHSNPSRPAHDRVTRGSTRRDRRGSHHRAVRDDRTSRTRGAANPQRR